MAWNEAVVTNDGLELLAGCVLGGSIEITSAVGGESASPAVSLLAAKEISGPNHLLHTAKTERIEKGVRVNVRVQNIGLAEGYRLRQIGLFARTAGSAEPPVLLALIQDGVGEEVPSEEENPEYLLEYDFVIPLSNSENICVQVTPNTFATLEDMALMNAHINDRSNPHAVTKAQVGLGNVPDVATNDQTPTYTLSADLSELSGGEKLSSAFGKLAKAVKELIAHLADNTRHITSSERTAWNGKAAGSHTHLAASSSANGFMSREDKAKLDGIAAGANKYIHPTAAGSKHIPTGGSSGQILRWSADGTAVWGADNNTTYGNMTGATTAAAGKAGLVPAPSAGAAVRYLRSDGTWQVPPDTNTTYGAATQSANGLMSAADKKKLDGIAAGANAYAHPAYTARTGAPAANQTPAFGGTFSITQPVSDGSGHITAMNGRTVKIPNTAASASAAGLMSKADKIKLDAIKLSGFSATFGNVAVNVSSQTVTINHKVDMLVVFFNQHSTSSSATPASVILTPSVTSASIMYGSVKLTCSGSSATAAFTFTGVNSQNKAVQNYAAFQLS